MNKNTVVTCLANSRKFDEIENAEIAVQSIFLVEFPKFRFRELSTAINDHAARQTIKIMGHLD